MASRPAQAGIAADHRRIAGGFCVRLADRAQIAADVVPIAARGYECAHEGRRQATRSIWLEPDGWSVGIIDQTVLPHRFATLRLTTLEDAAHAIKSHAGARRAADRRRGGLRHVPRAARRCLRRRPGARLRGAARDAADRDQSEMGARRDDGRGAQPAARGARRRGLPPRRRDLRRGRRHQPGDRPARPEADRGRSPRAKKPASPSTCSPIATPAGSRPSTGAPRPRRSTWRTTRAFRVHVWVDETRPRNQGASLTAWELGQHGVPHTVIPDNTGGHLMQHGMVDMVIVGTDRVTAQGDVCNKIGTYLKALAAQGQRRAVLCGAAVADHRLHRAGRRRRNPDRAARRRRESRP